MIRFRFSLPQSHPVHILVPRSSASHCSVAIKTTLQNEANHQYGRYMNAYMKGIIPCRGLKAPQIQRIVKEWKTGSFQGMLYRDTGFELISSGYLEDKIAGSILLQEAYSGTDSRHLDYLSEIRHIEQLFERGLIPGWAATDTMCNRPLAALIKSASDAQVSGYGCDVCHNGYQSGVVPFGQQEDGACSVKECCAEVLAWSHAEDTWKARASVVTFVPFARKPELYPTFRQDLVEAAAVTVQHPDRFVQLGTGWMLRDLGKQDTEALLEFCRTHLHRFSAEGLRYALEKQPRQIRVELQKHRNALKRS